ncbi:Wzz/FepE/Etk N-terminal domain-containing protein [Loigolactobacillus binensis]|uniref:Wzz/FepE/Etk N-terminal domain-containing protein n=1 Tax=Loigolactobacillus binensis TaxID=2559922 RepID=A0ABW3ECK8_9LACO|nr:Wzz/FepE/Etk N-terminal domain-containing protein [Loigolactobacillus binensis]
MLEFNSLLALLKRHWRLISITTIIALSLSILLTFFIAKPKYDSTVDVLTTDVSTTNEPNPSIALPSIINNLPRKKEVKLKRT